MDELKNLLNADVFLGRGWSFPPELTDNGGRYPPTNRTSRKACVYCSALRPARQHTGRR